MFPYFNPRSPRGGATVCAESEQFTGIDFNPRSPRGGATKAFPLRFYVVGAFQSTLPARGSDSTLVHIPLCNTISIHAPREGERLPTALANQIIDKIFQSTLPARGSDRGLDNIWIRHIHFNPRSPRGGATPSNSQNGQGFEISIHAPREGERHNAG